MSVSAHQKNYLADKKPFFKHFYPNDIAITAMRSIAIQGLMVFNGYVASLELEDEDDEDSSDDEVIGKKASDKPEFVAPSMEEFASSCTKSFIKSISISTYVRSLEDVSLRYFRPQIVSKLIKVFANVCVANHCASAHVCSYFDIEDVSKSASRKYVRTSSRFAAATLMVKTGMRANILSHFAIFLVEETHQIILILYRRFTAKASKKSGKHLRTISEGEEEKDGAGEKPTFAEITMRNASRSGLAIITGGVGAAIGTLIRPGLGTVIGGTLGDTIAYVM